jgi:uncharacterized protein (DUF2336 family)
MNETKRAVKADGEDLIELARDKSKAGRSALVEAVSTLYSGDSQNLTPRDLEIMADIIRHLIREVELDVRQALAARFAEQPDAPEDLIFALANDEIEVAYPILTKSEVLGDNELIEIVRQRTMEHQLAIALRAIVSEEVSNVLVEAGNEKVVTTLIRNQGAEIAENTMEYLVKRSRTIVGYQELLTYRNDLSPRLASELYWTVSAALREHIAANFDIDPDELDAKVESTAQSAIARTSQLSEEHSADRQPRVTENTSEAHRLIKLLRSGDIAAFLDSFRVLSGLYLPLVRRVLFEPGGEELAIACKAIGFPKDAFVEILVHFRMGRLGDQRIEQDELPRALEFYESTDAKTAKILLRQWRRDPDCLNLDLAFILRTLREQSG